MDASYAMGRPGEITGREVERLAWLAGQVRDGGLIVEIGAYKGRSAAALLAGMKANARLVSIDPWVLLPQATPQGYETMDTVGEYRKSVAPRKDDVTQIIGWPLEVAKWWRSPIDLLFVDCVKKYEMIHPIWVAWLPFCRRWVASHDYEPHEGHEQHYPGVVRAINELCIPMTRDHHHVDYTWSGKLKGAD